MMSCMLYASAEKQHLCFVQMLFQRNRSGYSVFGMQECFIACYSGMKLSLSLDSAAHFPVIWLKVFSGVHIIVHYVH
ncbi:hypothetical protein EI42_01664 [Thermosporothrix hazakensis]|jgi:hypothetical protein|uniref:Uncharacterized protein n=1 Tax=Thermosporothrix hazakensis TaxID=644383 RepID=A0A326U9S3_THEHA|nr:hypothetical protein EI42_01664 [Thermosporothrix hazakensis]